MAPRDDLAVGGAGEPAQPASPGSPEETVAGQVRALAGLSGRPLAEQAAEFERIHAELQAALAGVDLAEVDPATGAEVRAPRAGEG